MKYQEPILILELVIVLEGPQSRNLLGDHVVANLHHEDSKGEVAEVRNDTADGASTRAVIGIAPAWKNGERKIE